MYTVYYSKSCDRFGKSYDSEICVDVVNTFNDTVVMSGHYNPKNKTFSNVDLYNDDVAETMAEGTFNSNDDRDIAIAMYRAQYDNEENE